MSVHVCSIGEVYRAQSKFAEAMDYCNRSLDINLRVHGPEHPDVASTFNNIGIVYRKMGEHEKALEYYNKDLAITIKVHGQDHSHMADTYNK